MPVGSRRSIVSRGTHVGLFKTERRQAVRGFPGRRLRLLALVAMSSLLVFCVGSLVARGGIIYELNEKKWNKTAPAGHKWFLASGWQQRTAELFTIAGEVEKKAPAKP
jgi:hypothetical protein